MKIISTLFFGDVNAFESGFGPVVPPNMTVIMYVLDELIIDSGPYHLRKQAAQILEGRQISHVFFFRRDERIAQQIASLKKVLAYDFDALFCAHRPVPKNGKARLASKLAFLEDFHGKICASVRNGYSEKEIIRAMQSKSDLKVKLITMGNASFANMVRSSLRDATEGSEIYP